MGRRPVVILWALAASAVLMTGCAPASEPEGSPTSTTVPSVTPTPTETAKEIALPASCEDAYSPEYAATLTAQNLPLNDATLTMESTQVEAARALIAQSTQTVHCTWGVASEVGISTDILHIDQAQATDLEAALTAAGFECTVVDADTDERRCTHQEEFTGDLPATVGEIHVLRDNIWISTAWINLDMSGYADDMVTALWSAEG